MGSDVFLGERGFLKWPVQGREECSSLFCTTMEIRLVLFSLWERV